MELTKESKKIFISTIKKVTKELDELRRMSKDDISIPIELKTRPKSFLYAGKWFLKLDKNEFMIDLSYACIVFGKKNKFGRYVIPKEDFGTHSTEILIAFLEEYPEVRKRVAYAIELNEKKHVEEMARKKEDQEKTLERLRDIQNRCNNMATIEIQMPKTNNQHEIEIKEKNGSKIGTIKVNGLTLKIITSGDVKITNDTELDKVKSKNR